jgi:hypothetical protein
MTTIDANDFLEKLLRPLDLAGPAITLAEPPTDISPWNLPSEWRERWEERAAIMEYEAKMPKERAEFYALGDILRQMKLAGVPLPRIDV